MRGEAVMYVKQAHLSLNVRVETASNLAKHALCISSLIVERLLQDELAIISTQRSFQVNRLRVAFALQSCLPTESHTYGPEIAHF